MSDAFPPEAIDRLDKDLFLAVNGGLHRVPGTGLDDVMRFVNEMGNGVVLAPILVLVVLGGGSLRACVRRVLQLGVALAISGLASSWLKHEFARPRPHLELAEAFATGQAFMSFGERQRAFGFPSGHVTTVCALAVVLVAWAWRFPERWRRYVALAAASISVLLTAVARVYSGAHYPLDSLGGIVLGAVAGLLGVAAGALIPRRGVPAPVPVPAPERS